ncbi:hypothetical protein AABB24_023127 [Solanum stoloniferum]|uniref:Uncharacterized protein n=1 Tax=Solanum stoloniferum TaxID=62892 RepID=A0ABD2T2R3_9SOLN
MDDDDVSWKVRRAAAKCLAALVVTQPEMLSKLYKQACSKLIDKFKERKSKMALNCCDKQAMLQKDSTLYDLSYFVFSVIILLPTVEDSHFWEHLFHFQRLNLNICYF